MAGAYRTPDERFRNLTGYDFEPHYVELDELRMHFVDEGSGDPVLLLHGEPTWSYLYRKMIPILRRRTRVVAPDYFGFGRSDKPVDRASYSFDRHTWSVTELIRRLDLWNLTVVVQDWGGPIGLRFATENPERVARLVVLNTALFVPSPTRPPSEGFMTWRHFAERVGLEMPIGFVVQSGSMATLPEDVRAGYEAPFPVPESKMGAAMFPLLVPLSKSDPGAEAMAATRSGIAKWTKPALVMFSDSDPVFSSASGRKLADLIPGCRGFEVVQNAGHFLQEESGEEIAERIVRFLDEP